jgi:hypothetical protein
MLNFMPSLPPTLPSHFPCSHTSCLPWLAVMLPLVLRCLSFLSLYRLLSSGASTCPPLVVLSPLVLPLFFSGVVATCLPRLAVMSPLVMPPPSIRLHLHLSSHCHCTPLMPFDQLVVTLPISILFTSAIQREAIASSLAVSQTSSPTTHREFA